MSPMFVAVGPLNEIHEFPTKQSKDQVKVVSFGHDVGLLVYG